MRNGAQMLFEVSCSLHRPYCLSGPCFSNWAFCSLAKCEQLLLEGLRKELAGGGERGRNIKDQGEERGVEDQYMGGLFWHKIGLWSKRPDQLSVMWSMFYSSRF